jgi:hypothetical protein
MHHLFAIMGITIGATYVLLVAGLIIEGIHEHFIVNPRMRKEVQMELYNLRADRARVLPKLRLVKR